MPIVSFNCKLMRKHLMRTCSINLEKIISRGLTDSEQMRLKQEFQKKMTMILTYSVAVTCVT